MRILVVEDEQEIASFIQHGLVAANFSVDCASDAETGLRLAKLHTYDAIVLDRILHQRDGLDVCRELREHKITTPVIMLSVMADTEDKVQALNTGADDYLTKPFSFEELLARIRALLRREKPITAPTLRIADLEFDTLAYTVTRAERPIRLTKKELELLEYFMRHPRVILTRAMLLEHVWDMNADPFTNTVDVHVRSLRRKICGAFTRKLLHTVRGFGYKLE